VRVWRITAARPRRLLLPVVFVVVLSALVAGLPGLGSPARAAAAPVAAPVEPSGDGIVAVPPPCPVYGVDCHASATPTGLWSPGALAAADPATRAALEALQEKAIANTFAHHDLPASDREAVLSWGRHDALAELWILVMEAVQTPAAERTAEQRLVAVWMGGEVATKQAQYAAQAAGAEYARWAGMDVRAYWQLVYSGASQDDIKA